MSTTKWQCRQCGTTQITQGLRPSVGGFCGKSSDHQHKWSKVSEKQTRWQCKNCGTTQLTGGVRPSVGSFCGKSSDHKHKWVKLL